MREFRILAIAAFFVLIGTPCAFSDQASHQQAVNELLEVTNARSTLEQFMGAFSQMMESQLSSMDLPPESEDDVRQLQAEALAWMEEMLSWDELKGLYNGIYMEVFTEAEIREMISFYKSPLGRKMLAKMPALIEKTMMRAQEMIERKMPEFQERLDDAIEKLEEKYDET